MALEFTAQTHRFVSSNPIGLFAKRVLSGQNSILRYSLVLPIKTIINLDVFLKIIIFQ